MVWSTKPPQLLMVARLNVSNPGLRSAALAHHNHLLSDHHGDGAGVHSW